jgi:hypothetical protein
VSIAVELWRALEAWNPDLHPRWPKGHPKAGKFMGGGGGGGGGGKHGLADAVHGTAAAGPKRQRGNKGGMSVADAVRKAARTSDTTGRPTQHDPSEHRAHGAHDVADEVERALADVDIPDEVRELIAAKARVAASKHGLRPESLPRPPKPAKMERPKASQAEIQGDIFDAVKQAQDKPGTWVGLADVRDRLGKHSREDVDSALRGLLGHEGVRVIPVANVKSLQPRDRAAAVRIGGEDSHMMSIDPGASRPGTAKGAAPTAPVATAAAAPAVPKAERVAAAKADVYDAVKRLQSGSGAYVALSRLRNDLGDRHDRKDVDTALDELYDLDGVNLEPEANQKTLDMEDRRAAIHIGGEDRHLVAIEPHVRRPGAAKAAEQPRIADNYERAAKGIHGTMSGKQAWGELLAGPRKEDRPGERKWTDSELAAERKKINDRTAAATANATRRQNVFADPAFNASTGGLAPREESRDAATTQRLADALHTAKSRDEARAAISKQSVSELRKLAERLGVKPGAKATKAKLVDSIVDNTTGRRLDSEALGR